MKTKKPPDTRKISEMRNLGPACERDLNAVGICTAQDLLDIGVEGAFLALLQGRIARGLNVYGCNAGYLYALYGAIHDVDWREVPERKKAQFKKWTAEMRDAGVGLASQKESTSRSLAPKKRRS